MGSTEQTKTGNLIIEGVLRLGQFTTANAPSGTEGALYYNTTDNATKLYSDGEWGDLGGGWDGVLPNYTTAQRNALSLADGLIVYNTTDKTVQIYKSGAWANVGAGLSLAATCNLDGDCDSTHCVDGVCCATTCDGNCNRCNVAGSEGICTDTNSDCTGNCDVCSSGNCIANVSLCASICDQCIGSGTIYNCAADVTFTYKGSSVTYGMVSSLGKCWMDRNLGASQVATAYNDSLAYGDLFQWGRLVDGHQTRTSGITTTLSTTDVPGHSNFIYGMSLPYNWRSPHNDSLWQGVSGINNPCPSGWRIPTSAELDAERASWSQQNYNGAFASPLKLPAGGYRDYYGALPYRGVGGYFWSSTVNDARVYNLSFYNTVTYMDYYYRMYGFSVRCVQD